MWCSTVNCYHSLISMKIFELALSEIAIMEFTLIKDSMYTAVYTYIYM